VPKLLGTLSTDTPFDKVREDAAGLWAIVRRALDEGVDQEGEELEAEDVASLVCQLAVMFSACSLPHHYERGLALSLWPESQDAVPESFAHSPEPLFVEVVKKYPRLHGQFPNWFSGNFSTGVYVPAGKVHEVRAWVEEAVAKLDKGKRRRYRGLLAVLKTAEAKNLAYWEATDLALPMANAYPGDPELMTADFLRKVMEGEGAADKFALPMQNSFDRKAGLGNLHVLSHARPDGTIVVDLIAWPPVCHVRPQEFAWNVDVDAQGTWLFASRTGPGDHLNPVRGRVLADPRGLPSKVLQLPGGLDIDHGYLVSGRVLLIPDPGNHPDAVGTQVHPWLEDGGTMIPAPGLRPHTVKAGKFGNEWIVHDIARLADGTEVLLWDGDGYEWDGKTFRLTFPMGLTDPHDPLSSIPVDDEGFYFISGRKLLEVHRGRPPLHHAPEWKNVLRILPGPQNGLLLKEGDNPDGDLGKLYFPADGSFIHIEPDLLGNQELYDFLCWSDSAQRIIASDHYHLYAVAVDEVLELPRHGVKASTAK
jgi:hypothetical protein